MERYQNRRRNYYIKKEFQRNFILKFCALVILGGLISGAIVYVMSSSTVTTTFENSRLTIKSTADFILPALLLSSAIAVALIGIATIVITLFTSHKIAGPLYRMEKDVNEVAAGNLGMNFHLRSTDELKPLAVSLDMMVHQLKARVESIRNGISELDALIGRSETGKNADVMNKLKEIESVLNKFRF